MLAYRFQQTTWTRPIWEDGKRNATQFAALQVGDVVARHGDVILKRTDRKVDTTRAPLPKMTLYKGVNNTHDIAGAFYVTEDEGKRYVGLLGEAKLSHAEHSQRGDMALDAATIEHTELEQAIQLEYDHWLEESRQVID